MAWSEAQEGAIKEVRKWLRDKKAPQVFRLFGYAGTGKTTLARELAGNIHGRVLFGAFTGKAALVLRRKGCLDASTIHSMIYKLDNEDGRESDQPKFKINFDSPARGAKLIVVDEVSMVDSVLGQDLLSFGTKVLVLGDPAQLPPVRGAGFFTEGIEPNVMLTEVHRQARDNPIIDMSMLIREGKGLQRGTYGDSRVIGRDEIDAHAVLSADQVLVGLNKTRESYNSRIRQLLNFDDPMPMSGDRLVCLRNDRELHLFNGGLFKVRKSEMRAGVVNMIVRSEDATADDPNGVAVSVKREFFEGKDGTLEWQDRRGFQEFTYGYALTCHKSQGSQWDNVVLFDESGSFRDNRSRWLYTGVTRAAYRITVVQ